jgi:hypothetical protein
MLHLHQDLSLLFITLCEQVTEPFTALKGVELEREITLQTEPEPNFTANDSKPCWKF